MGPLSDDYLIVILIFVNQAFALRSRMGLSQHFPQTAMMPHS